MPVFAQMLINPPLRGARGVLNISTELIIIALENIFPLKLVPFGSGGCEEISKDIRGFILV